MSADVIVYPLPTGRSGNTGRCSVLLAPRLRDEAALSTYNDWANWPAAVAGLSFQARVNGTVVPSTRVSPNPQSAVWAAIFAPNTPVEPHQYIERSNTTLVSFPAVEVDDQITAALTEVANTHPGGPGSYADLAALASVVALLGSGSIEAVEAYTATVGNPDAPPPLDLTPDFHGWLSLLAGHPALLRALGVVLDFELNLAGVANPNEVRIETDYGSIPNRRAAHLTMRTTDTFRAASDPDELLREVDEGWLRCADPHFSFQVSGAMEMALQFGQVARQEAADPDDPSTGGVPLPRNSGLALYRNNIAASLEARFDRQVELEDEVEDVLRGIIPTARLWAEDTIVGYRFDIWDNETTDWHTLYARTPDGPYQFPRAPSAAFTPPADEGLHVLTLSSDGYESSTTTERVIGSYGELPAVGLRTSKAGDQRVPPNVVAWRGWSNAVAAPRRVFETATGTAVAPPAPEPGPEEVQLAIARSVTPDSLPRLRYGVTYRIRGRSVDLAGNSLPPPPGIPPSALAASNSAFFGRSAIPQVPVLRNELPPVPGAFESAISLVLRSDYDIDDATVPPTERMVFPPRTDQWQSELHALPKGGVDPGSFAELLARDAAILGDEATRTEGGELLWGEFSGDDFIPGDTSPPVPYLADPAGVGLAISNAPQTSDPVQVPWQGTWPALEGGRLVVRAGDAPPSTRPAPDVLAELWLPKAVQTNVLLSPYADAPNLEKFRMWPLIEPDVRDLVRQGRHVMFGQQVRVNLVHAVRRPLAAPLAGELASERPDPNATIARVTGPVTIDGASTGSLVMRATWTETVDDPTNPDGPQEMARSSRAREGTPSRADEIEARHVLELSSTKRAELSIELDAISAFVDYFLEEKTMPLNNSGSILDSAGVLASKVSLFRNGERLKEGRHYALNHQEGTVRRLATAGFPNGATVTARYVARPVLRESTEHTPTATGRRRCRPVLRVPDPLHRSTHRRVTQRVVGPSLAGPPVARVG